MNFRLERIDPDQTIQCRVSIDKDAVDEYAEKMQNGTQFPPVVLYGTKELAWIGDGWHRVLASEKMGAKTINAELRPGGRLDALSHALGANTSHGLKRTNKDKRRAVEIALREFSDLSSRQIAEKCGVSPGFVDNIRAEVPTVGTCHRKGADGKTYPAARETRFPRDEREPEGNKGTEETEREEKRETEERKSVQAPTTRPRSGMFIARQAVGRMGEMRKDDLERDEAFDYVRDWLIENR